MSGARILLKHTETKRYLGRGGTWTDKPEAALAFLDEIRAKDHSIYHRLANTEVVVLAERGAAKAPVPATPVIANQNPMPEEPTVKSRKSQTRNPKLAKTKETRLKSIEQQLPTDQKDEHAGGRSAANPRSTEGQTDEALVPSEQPTIIQARVDVGFGNSLFIRGQGDGLSWDKGIPLRCMDGSAWVWSTRQLKGKVVFKLLLNDQVWAKGEDVVVQAGRKIEIVPVF